MSLPLPLLEPVPLPTDAAEFNDIKVLLRAQTNDIVAVPVKVGYQLVSEFNPLILTFRIQCILTTFKFAKNWELVSKD